MPSLWWFLLVITFPSKTLSQVDFLVDLFSFEFCMRIVTPFDKTSSPEKFGGFITPKPFMSYSCLKPSRLIASREPFQGCCRYSSTFLPTLSQSKCIHCNLEDTHGIRITIDHFQWPLLCCCLLEVYLAPRSLYSPCASHALLAIK
jgi:hypothetical protein